MLPEIGLLDPVERLERLQPLERQASDFQTKVRTIKTDFNDKCFQNDFSQYPNGRALYHLTWYF